MKTQEIGQSGMIASRVALGVMRMDALDAADAARTVAVAHDSGIDYFDTAECIHRCSTLKSNSIWRAIPQLIAPVASCLIHD